MKPVSLVIMTANSWRHKYFANRLIENFDVLGVVSEVKRELKKGETEEENQVIAEHSKEREKSELEYFGSEKDFNLPQEKILRVDYDEANTQRVFDWVAKLNPDYIALFGTGIIKEPYLSKFENRIINMHLGLSPYYRGSGTNFWPLVYGEPELVGVTVHLAIDKVDAGSILAQARPDIAPGDGPHDIGHKAIIAGVDSLIRAIELYAAKKIIPQTQDLTVGKVIKHKDFNADAVLQMKKNFESGMVGEYLANKTDRLNKYPIIELK